MSAVHPISRNRALFKSAGGYQWLPPAGLYYARARCYLPWHGRWLQPDPLGQAGGLNLYTYCANDPVNGIDPSGMTADDLHKVALSMYGWDSDMNWAMASTGMASYDQSSGQYVAGIYQHVSNFEGYTSSGVAVAAAGHVDGQSAHSVSISYVTYGDEWSDADRQNFGKMFDQQWGDPKEHDRWMKMYSDDTEYKIIPDRLSGAYEDGATAFTVLTPLTGPWEKFLGIFGVGVAKEKYSPNSKVRDVLSGDLNREALSQIELNQAADFYKNVETKGGNSDAARLYNDWRANYLRYGGTRPPTLLQYMKMKDGFGG